VGYYPRNCRTKLEYLSVARHPSAGSLDGNNTAVSFSLLFLVCVVCECTLCTSHLVSRSDTLTGNIASTSNNPSMSSSVLSCGGFDKQDNTQSSVPLDPYRKENSSLAVCTWYYI